MTTLIQVVLRNRWPRRFVGFVRVDARHQGFLLKIFFWKNLLPPAGKIALSGLVVGLPEIGPDHRLCRSGSRT